MSKRTRRIGKRRLAYSLAAGAAVVTCAGDAEAGVIYSGILNTPILQNTSLALDLDGDSTDDILLDNYTKLNGNYQAAFVDNPPGKVVGFYGSLTNNAYVTALGPGFMVDASSVGPMFYGALAYGSVYPEAQFNNAIGAFIGFSFPSGGELHYAWLRVNVDNAAGTFAVTDYAYESLANAGILTGDTGEAGIPEPGTLGLLAAGAGGLAILRSRRKASV